MKTATKRSYWLLLFLLSVVSCEQPEIPVDVQISDALSISEVSMGTDYRRQIFFDLEKDSIISSNEKFIWDIAFDGQETPHIYINSAKFMSVYNTGAASLDAVTDTTGFSAGALFDVSSGNPDSTAFGMLDVGTVYLIDLGRTAAGLPAGFVKCVIENSTPGEITFSYANIDGSNAHTSTLTANAGHNVTCYSFISHSAVEIEPEANAFDLLFTQYTYYFEAEDIYYLVTGVLLNRSGTFAAVDTLHSFEEITLADTAGVMLTDKMDVIGYDWKYYNFDLATYEVVPGLNYIIRTVEGNYYKLHFIDFYDALGNRGNPVFEFQLLY